MLNGGIVSTVLVLLSVSYMLVSEFHSGQFSGNTGCVTQNEGNYGGCSRTSSRQKAGLPARDSPFGMMIYQGSAC